MKALILCGKEDSNFKHLTKYIPKPMLPVCSTPIIDYTVKMCLEAGIKPVYILAGERANVIGDYYKRNDDVIVLREGKRLGTGGAIQSFLSDEHAFGHFVVVNGDNIYNLNLKDMMKYHLAHRRKITIGVHHVDDVSPYGHVMINRDVVKSFKEKPQRRMEGFASVGLYIIKGRLFTDKETFLNEQIMLEEDIFPRYAQHSQIRVYKKVDWIPIDEESDLVQAEDKIRRGWLDGESN